MTIIGFHNVLLADLEKLKEAIQQQINLLKMDIEALDKENRKTLDAIRAHLDAVPCDDDADFFKWDISPISFNELMKNLYEILPPKEEKP